jgi:CRISPR-associated protein (TIGR03984 family)
MSIQLKCRRTQGQVSLQECLTQTRDWRKNPMTIALLYTPSACFLAQAQGEGVTGYDGKSADLTTVFEARIFNPSCEVRWLHKSGGKGSGVFLSENASGPGDWVSLSPVGSIKEPENHRYLLWGMTVKDDAKELATGWSWLAAANIGKYAIPLAGDGLERRARLVYREYIGLAPGEAGDRHGNVTVCEERLLGFEWFPGETQKNFVEKSL